MISTTPLGLILVFFSLYMDIPLSFIMEQLCCLVAIIRMGILYIGLFISNVLHAYLERSFHTPIAFVNLVTNNISRTVIMVQGQRAFHTAVVVGNSMIVMGGEGPNGLRNDVWQWNFILQNWTQLNSLEEPVYGHSTVYLLNSLLIFGGNTDTGIVNDIWKYSLTTNVISIANSSADPTPVWEHSAVVVGEEMISFGGLTTTGPVSMYV
jgi:hypothetical protein